MAIRQNPPSHLRADNDGSSVVGNLQTIVIAVCGDPRDALSFTCGQERRRNDEISEDQERVFHETFLSVKSKIFDDIRIMIRRDRQ
jgi:hypothetical protein